MTSLLIIIALYLGQPVVAVVPVDQDSCMATARVIVDEVKNEKGFTDVSGICKPIDQQRV